MKPKKVTIVCERKFLGAIFDIVTSLLMADMELHFAFDDEFLKKKIEGMDFIFVFGDGQMFVETLDKHPGELPVVWYLWTVYEPQSQRITAIESTGSTLRNFGAEILNFLVTMDE